MHKNLVLFTNAHSLLRLLRLQLPAHWNIRFFSSLKPYQDFKPPKPPDGILIDFALPLSCKQKISAYVQRHSSLPILYISFDSPAVTAAAVLRLPRDLPLLTAKLKAMGQKTVSPPEIYGTSSATANFRNNLAAVARSTTPVLLTGASGTGKTLGASVIHALSARNRAEFYAVNVATIPEYLAESELFGTVRGAFTDAELRRGYFAASDGGTLFLDEIAELSLNVQAKLLHVLESGRFRSVGSDVAQKSTARLIFATNVDLRRRVKQRLFRQDLYYRISQLVVRVPSLAERKDDIPLLSRQFLAKYGKRLTSAAELLLCSLRWDGNVRQLHNCLERAAVYCKSDIIDVNDIVLE